MGLVAKEKGNGDFSPVSEGLHVGICYAIYDLGTQHSDKFNKDIRQVLLTWELPDERIEIEKDGEKLNLPRAISKRYGLSLSAKAILRKDLESWRGQRFTEQELKGFDLQKLLGIGCQLQILHNKKDGNTYANVTAIVPLPKGTPKKNTENPIKFFSFDDEGGEALLPENTPEWISDIIEESSEWNNQGKAKEEPPPPDWLQGGPEPAPAADDDIPF